MAKPTDESSDVPPASAQETPASDVEQTQSETPQPEKMPDDAAHTEMNVSADPTTAPQENPTSDIEQAQSETPHSEKMSGDATPTEMNGSEPTASDVLPETVTTDAAGAPSEDMPPSSDSPEFVTAEGLDPAAVALQLNIDQQGDDATIAASIIDNIDEDALLQQVAGVFMLWWHWAYFEITVTSPSLPAFHPPQLIKPAPISGTDDIEFVYNILDSGNKLSTSKGEDMYSGGMSMCKMYYTIEKIIFMLIQRLKNGGVSTDTEVQVTFDGHLLGQRKAFESIINLNYNVIVTNFDPGAWGERYLEIVKRLADKGYGYPPEAPRESYKLAKKKATGPKR